MVMLRGTQAGDLLDENAAVAIMEASQ